MGCNCGSSAAKKEFVHTRHNGREEIHPTLVAARAAQIRDKRAGFAEGSIREQVKK